jgi:hypothetical protein
LVSNIIGTIVMSDKPNSFEAKTKVLPKLLVDKAYEMLTSGEKLTASELKVCLDTCKTYGVEVDEQPQTSITDSLPFDES